MMRKISAKRLVGAVAAVVMTLLYGCQQGIVDSAEEPMSVKSGAQPVQGDTSYEYTVLPSGIQSMDTFALIQGGIEQTCELSVPVPAGDYYVENDPFGWDRHFSNPQQREASSSCVWYDPAGPTYGAKWAIVTDDVRPKVFPYVGWGWHYTWDKAPESCVLKTNKVKATSDVYISVSYEIDRSPSGLTDIEKQYDQITDKYYTYLQVWFARNHEYEGSKGEMVIFIWLNECNWGSIDNEYTRVSIGGEDYGYKMKCCGYCATRTIKEGIRVFFRRYEPTNMVQNLNVKGFVNYLTTLQDCHVNPDEWYVTGVAFGTDVAQGLAHMTVNHFYGGLELDKGLSVAR